MPKKWNKKGIGPIQRRCGISKHTVCQTDHRFTGTVQVLQCDKKTDTSDLQVNESSVFKDIAMSVFGSLPNWYVENGCRNEDIRVFQLHHEMSTSSWETQVPIHIARLLIVMNDHSWVFFLNGLCVPCSSPCLQEILVILSTESFTSLIQVVKSGHICPANPDEDFVKLCKQKKGTFYGVTHKAIASLHITEECLETVRHVQCELLVNERGKRCVVCAKYRNRLRAMYSRFSKLSNTSCFNTNIRYLRTPQQKQRIIALRKRIKNSTAKNRRLCEKLQKITASSGVTTYTELQDDLLQVIEKNKENMNDLDQSDFRQILWEQQVIKIIDSCDRYIN
jgi:hypothetical protein